MKEQKKITLDSTVVAKPDLISAPMDDSLVMLDLQSGKYFGLDDIATVIWDAIASPVSVRDLCDWLQVRYDVDSTTCQSDTLSFLNQLYEDGLLRVDDAASA